MRITVLTLFPEVFAPHFTTSILGRAIERGLLEVSLINIRDFATNKHQTVDDTPYGGGPGMVIRVDVTHRAIIAAKEKVKSKKEKVRTVLLEPSGERLRQEKVGELEQLDHLILVAGHYEGMDARVEAFIDEVISIGDYVLSGGELPALVIIEAVARLLPGVTGDPESPREESFSFEDPSTGRRLLEYPHYTRPEEYRGLNVPAVLLSGNHKKIAAWRVGQARRRSKGRPIK